MNSVCNKRSEPPTIARNIARDDDDDSRIKRIIFDVREKRSGNTVCYQFLTHRLVGTCNRIL